MKESQLENKTSIATNDYVRMVDENNNSVKIKKDSFMAAIRDALPSIISDGETGGGSVLSIINGALKTRTDANLASVLGGTGMLNLKTRLQNSSGTSIYYNFATTTGRANSYLINIGSGTNNFFVGILTVSISAGGIQAYKLSSLNSQATSPSDIKIGWKKIQNDNFDLGIECGAYEVIDITSFGELGSLKSEQIPNMNGYTMFVFS